MQTLYSLGEVLPLLRHRGICRCLWHRARIFRVPTAHPDPETHTVPPAPPGLGSDAKELLPSIS